MSLKDCGDTHNSCEGWAGMRSCRGSEWQLFGVCCAPSQEVQAAQSLLSLHKAHTKLMGVCVKVMS